MNFSTFWTFCFYSLERRFFLVEYRKKHFPGLFCLKRKSSKNGHCYANPFRRMSIFLTFWTSSFYSLERRFFVLEYRNGYFPGLYCLKKKVRNMTIIRPKPWINPFGKMWICRLFKLLFFYSLEKGFFVLDRKRHFPGLLYCLRKKLENWPLLDQNHGLEKWPFLDQNDALTPLEKCQIFDFLNEVFFLTRMS